MLLKNAKDINSLVEAVKKCKGDVVIRSTDGTEEFNLKSTFSQYIAIGRLCDEYGEYYEVFCMNKEDEPYMIKFFYDLTKEK